MAADPIATDSTLPSERGARATLALIAASAAATLVTWHADIDATYRWLAFADFVRSGDERVVIHADRFHDVLRGQAWRLATPALVHVKFLHLALNLVGLWVFGSAIEKRRGPAHLAALVVALVILGNVAQYLWHGPFFGGMSGVVYGLLGYIWMRRHRDPACDLPLPGGYVVMMSVWLLYSLVFLPEAGNAAHLSGLGIGLLWGAMPPRRWSAAA